jgi:hypothetical protein
VAEKKKDARRSGTLTARIGSLQNLSDPAMWETAIHAVSQTHYGESACLDVVPTASRCVATALARSSVPCMIVA